MFAPTSLVLVCVLPEPRDLEIARVLGWYRIPFKSAPKVVRVDCLALYQPGRFNQPERHPGGTTPTGQPSSFEDEGGRIRYVAEVKGHELTTRRELLRDEPDHPRANEEYFKIQIGALEKLSQPIVAEKWHRITFFYTSGEYLLRAKTLNDRVVHAEERQLLWHSLRERAVTGQRYQTDLPGFDLNPEMLIVLLGIKELQAEYPNNDHKDQP